MEACIGKCYVASFFLCVRELKQSGSFLVSRTGAITK